MGRSFDAHVSWLSSPWDFRHTTLIDTRDRRRFSPLADSPVLFLEPAESEEAERALAWYEKNAVVSVLSTDDRAAYLRREEPFWAHMHNLRSPILRGIARIAMLRTPITKALTERAIYNAYTQYSASTRKAPGRLFRELSIGRGIKFSIVQWLVLTFNCGSYFRHKLLFDNRFVTRDDHCWYLDSDLPINVTNAHYGVVKIETDTEASKHTETPIVLSVEMANFDPFVGFVPKLKDESFKLCFKDGSPLPADHAMHLLSKAERVAKFVSRPSVLRAVLKGFRTLSAAN